MPTTSGETRLLSATTQVATILDRRMLDGLAGGRSRRLSGARLRVTLLCSLVHLVTLGFVVAGLGALWPGTNVELKALGLLLLLVAFALRPTFPRAARGAGLLDPVTAPATVSLVADIAAAVGAPMPTRLEVGSRINASAALTGLRGRTLRFGAPLWAAASAQARVAILAHELSHFSDGDPLHGRYVAGALQTLEHWLSILTPVTTHSGSLTRNLGVRRGGIVGPGLQRVIYWPVRVVVAAYARLIVVVASSGHRRAEAVADLRAAAAAGTAGVVDSLELGLARLGIEVAANRAAVRREDLAPALLAFREQFGTEQRAGARRSGALEKSRLDAHHPLTSDRLRLVEANPVQHAAVTRTAEEWAVIDAEWAPAVASGLTELADSLRYRH